MKKIGYIGGIVEFFLAAVEIGVVIYFRGNWIAWIMAIAWACLLTYWGITMVAPKNN